MERNSKLEHLWDHAMPKKKIGLMKRTTKPPMTRKDQMAAYNRDSGKSSLRKASEVPGAAEKISINRMQLGGNLRKADKEARGYLENWLNNRKEILGQNLKDYPNATEYSPTKTVEAEIDRQLMGSNSSSVVPYDFTNEEIAQKAQHNSILGKFDESGRKILINKNLEHAADEILPITSLIHERTHALGSHTGSEPLAQEKAIKAAATQFKIPEAKTSFDKYLDKDSEIYGRLMETRRRFDLDPSKEVTEEKVNSMRKDPYFKQLHMDRYPNKFLLHLFNKIAQADKQPKQGGLLYG